MDDTIFAFKDVVWVAYFNPALGARFDINDLGVCAWALAMDVERDLDNATLKVHHAKYIDDVMHKLTLLTLTLRAPRRRLVLISPVATSC